MEHPGNDLAPTMPTVQPMISQRYALYAQWSANPTHTVTYANGGGTGTPPTQAPVSEGASFTVASDPSPRRFHLYWLE